MRAWLVATLGLAPACTLDYPDAGQSRVFGCKTDSDCLAGFVCVDNLCVEGSREAGSCGIPPWSFAPSTAEAPETVTPGTRVTVAAVGLPSPPDACSSAEAEWWICSVPAGSVYASTEEDCQLQDANGLAEVTFTPDRAGSYRVELRRGSSIHPVTVTAACEDAPVTLSPDATVEPGTATTASAAALPAAPDECSFANASWWVCNAPAGSSVAPSDGCQQLSLGQPNLVFVPDQPGTYDVEFRRPGGKVDTAALTAECQAATLAKDPETPVLPFDSVAVTVLVGSPPGVCAAANATWWVCDAPPDSSRYHTSDNDGCQDQSNDGASSLTVEPDASGAYRVELRRGGQVDSIVVEASCAAIPLESDSVDDRVYAGLEIVVSAVGLPSPPSDCSAEGATWWTCPDSSISCSSDSLATTCTAHPAADAQDSFEWRPMERGNYTVQLCRPGQTDSLAVEVLADALFAEVTYTDPKVLRQLMEAQAADLACRQYASDTCQGASGCAWDEDLRLCWGTCAHTETTPCNDDNACAWDDDAGTCNSTLNLVLACLLADNETDCLLIEEPGTDLAGCRWDSDTQVCGADVDCSNPAYVDQATCEANYCAWDVNREECVDLAAMAIPEPTIMQVYADGTEIQPLIYDAASNPRYRFDPNGVFTPLGLRAGTGTPAHTYGFGFVMGEGVAAIPHLYLYTRPGAAGEPAQCAISQTVLFWRQGAALGTPATVASLLEIQANLVTATDLPPPGVTALVGYPHVVPTSSTAYRIVMGKDPVESPDLSDCEAEEFGGEFYDMAYAVFPFALAAAPSPITNRKAMELWIADVDAGGSLVRSAQASVGANRHPCEEDDDCPTQTTGSCTANTCSTPQSIEGYLPRLVEHASGPGEHLLYSHATCSGGYGGDCDATSDGIDYDLMIAHLEVGTTNFDAVSFVANNPQVHELDAFLTGNPAGTPSVYYLGMEPNPQTVTTSDTDRTVNVPIFGLYKVNLSYDSPGSQWNVTTGPTELLIGSQRQMVDPEFPATPCLLDGTADLTVTSGWETQNPIHFTMSADKRYLAYAVATQQLECVSVFSLGSAEDEMQPGAPIQSDIYVIDVGSAGEPTRIYGEACVSSGPLDPVNVMPIFISGGAQLVFTSRASGEDPFVNSFFRYNLEDLDAGAPGCQVVPITDSDDIKIVLTSQVSPSLVPLGASLADSRTFVKPNCDCRGLSGDGSALLIGLALAALLRRRRSRQLPIGVLQGAIDRLGDSPQLSDHAVEHREGQRLRSV